VYGPVRTVVWQGSAGDRRPYADQTAFSEIDPINAEGFTVMISATEGLLESCALRAPPPGTEGTAP
jgi:hypothetical protein